MAKERIRQLESISSAHSGEAAALPSGAGTSAETSATLSSAGGSREAAMLRGVLLRFDHHSFEIGMGPQQISQLLEVLNRDVQELADAVIGSSKTQEVSSSSSSEDYEMTPCNEEDQAIQEPAAADSCADSLIRRQEISSQIVQMLFDDIMVRPLAAVGHDLSVVESSAQVGWVWIILHI